MDVEHLNDVTIIFYNNLTFDNLIVIYIIDLLEFI